MSNAADRDSDQFGIKMSVGRDLSLAGPIPQPCSKEEKGGHEGFSIFGNQKTISLLRNLSLVSSMQPAIENKRDCLGSFPGHTI